MDLLQVSPLIIKKTGEGEKKKAKEKESALLSLFLSSSPCPPFLSRLFIGQERDPARSEDVCKFFPGSITAPCHVIIPCCKIEDLVTPSLIYLIQLLFKPFVFKEVSQESCTI